MRNNRNQLEARQRTADRRQREDEAARLSNEVPRLDTLQLKIEDGDTNYVWRIVVERAPALFDIACAEHSCKDGGHDVTWEVMKALRSSATGFEGEHVCNGQVRSGGCGRVLRYVGTATHRA